MTPRDLRIFDRARELPHGDFERAVENLHRAVEELIPAGRLWPLGRTEHGPIIGSRVTGLGIAPSPKGVVLVQVHDGQTTVLGSFW